MKLQLAALRAKAARTGRGQAYIDDVLALATNVTGIHYELTDGAFARLRAKWGAPPRPRVTIAGLAAAHSAKARGCPDCRRRRAAAHGAAGPAQ